MKDVYIFGQLYTVPDETEYISQDEEGLWWWTTEPSLNEYGLFTIDFDTNMEHFLDGGILDAKSCTEPWAYHIEEVPNAPVLFDVDIPF